MLQLLVLKINSTANFFSYQLSASIVETPETTLYIFQIILRITAELITLGRMKFRVVTGNVQAM